MPRPQYGKPELRERLKGNSQKLKIGLAQIDCVVGDLDANCLKIEEFAERAKNEGCQVIIFPEMSDTGYVTSVISECAQTWPGKPFETASHSAARNSIALICGLSEREGDSIYNSIAVFDDSGKLLSQYRKTHLFSPAPVHEDQYCKPGNDFSLVEFSGLKWGLSICYDLRFPELYRALTLRGAEVLLNCAAWPALRPKHWDHLTCARAIENQVFFLGVDRVGTDGDLTFNGHSRIIDPKGQVVAEGSIDSEELVLGEIDPARITDIRSAIPAITSRRSDIYGDLGST